MENLDGLNPNDVQKIELVPLHIIQRDERYSRPLNEARVLRMAFEYNPQEIGTPILHRRQDGSLWVLDGNHRIKASRKKNIYALNCVVLDGLTIAQEAGRFHRLNALRGQLTPLDLHNAQKVAGNPIALDIQKIVHDEGYVFTRGGHQAGQINAVRGIENCYKWYGREELKLTLALIREAYAKNTEATQAWITDGLGKFFNAYREDPTFSFERLVKQMAKVPVETLKLKANTGKTRMIAATTAVAIAAEYNHGLSKTKRLDIGRIFSDNNK